MNLLTEAWIPVRPLPTGGPEKITLRRLLCEESRWELCLPRDDMELAALQMLVSVAQVFFIPKDVGELKQRIVSPLSPDAFDAGCEPFRDWFRVDHPDYPFMQVRGVSAKEFTPMDKLLAGLTGATNSCFVNEQGLGDCVCGGCAAIALFNQASCAPSFGGGFKSNLRDARWPGKDGRGGLSGAPITTLVQGEHLRQTVWFNVLSEDRLIHQFPWHFETLNQKPTWVDPIKSASQIPAQTIGLLRGLFWQPAHIELLPPNDGQTCSCCGFAERVVYCGFNKAKFNHSIIQLWPHPHSARTATVKKGVREEKFVSFTTSAPAWTQLSRFVVQRQTDGNGEGQEPAAVIRQAQGFIRGLRLNVGGYQNKLASILERRHELIFIKDGWSDKTVVIHELVGLATRYRDALNKALYVFSNGLKESKGQKIKGAGVAVHEAGKEQFYQRSEDTVLDALTCIDFVNPAPDLLSLGGKLNRIAVELFDESVRPYRNDPELVRTTAISRMTLYKHLNALKPQQDGRSDNGTIG